MDSGGPSNGPADQEELDLYELLGVDKTATPDQIKKAYRKVRTKKNLPPRFCSEVLPLTLPFHRLPSNITLTRLQSIYVKSPRSSSRP